jgi:hypothetical protein
MTRHLIESAMTVNQGVARFQHYAHEMLAQMQDTLRTFQRIVGPSCQTHLTFLFEAMRQRVDFLLSQGKPLWQKVCQRTDELLSRQRHLRLLATRARACVYAIRLQSNPLLHRIRHLYGTPSSSKTIPTLIVAALVGLALIILILLKIFMSTQAGNEHAGMVKEATPSPTHVPDWTIFDDAFANEPSRLATWEFVHRVRTSGAALTSDPDETSGQVMREAVPLPRPRPKHR